MQILKMFGFGLAITATISFLLIGSMELLKQNGALGYLEIIGCVGMFLGGWSIGWIMCEIHHQRDK